MQLPTYRFNQKTAISQIKTAIGSFLWLLGRRAFMVILVVVLLEILLGSFLCYWYVMLPDSHPSELGAEAVIFNSSAYEQALTEWEQRKQFSGTEVYSNPF